MRTQAADFTVLTLAGDCPTCTRIEQDASGTYAVTTLGLRIPAASILKVIR